MKGFYKEHFHISDDEKITEKAFLSKISVSILSIIFAIAMMTFSTFAFYANELYVQNNHIGAAEFKPEILVSVTDGVASSDGITVINYAHPDDSTQAKEYMIAINQAENNAETGFCTVTVNGETVYHTQQIGIDRTVQPETQRESVIFVLKLNTTAVIEISPHWGTSSYYAEYVDKGENDQLYITNGEIIEIGELLPEAEPVVEIPEETTTAPVTEAIEETAETTVVS